MHGDRGIVNINREISNLLLAMAVGGKNNDL